ncbi:MAG: DUF4272 domain-containing protein [Defluviitaleaceae bacterium]|nr:DUF4272 domain-containing protein [Defluviitaleaceae bacterium]
MFNISDNDINRRKRNIALLQNQSVPFFAGLPLFAFETEVKIPTSINIAKRIVATLAIAIYCEARRDGATWIDAQKYIQIMDEIMYGELDSELLPDERDFIALQQPDMHQLAKYGWRYERCYVYLWALGAVKELKYPSGICDVAAITRYVMQAQSLQKLVTNTKPRTKSEILDVADLNFRYDWACNNAYINGTENPAKLNNAVIYERLAAFEWLLCISQ